MTRARPGIRARCAVAAYNAAGRASLALFEHRTADAVRVNEQTLRRILERNRSTRFGRAYEFGRLCAARDLFQAFRATVPLRTYEDFRPYIDLIAGGEKNVLTRDPVECFAGSAGTTGSAKRLPTTCRARRRFAYFLGFVQRGVLHRALPGACSTGVGINLMSLQLPDAGRAGRPATVSLPSAGLQSLRHRIPFLWCSPEAVFTVKNAYSALYLHAFFGLRRDDATSITAIFGPHVTAWFRLIEDRQSELASGIEHGRLPRRLRLSGPEREAILPHLYPDPARADTLRRVFAAGFAGIIPQFWPRMRHVMAGTTGGFSVCLPKLRWLAGDRIAIFSPAHAASEAVVGINLGVDAAGDYALACGGAAFEFIPLDAVGQLQPRTVGPGELCPGRSYEVVLTNHSGLYRYRLADLIRVTGYYRTAPVFRFLHRRDAVLDLAGEKTSEEHLSGAVNEWLGCWFGAGEPVTGFAVAADTESVPGRYVLFVEAAPGAALPGSAGSGLEADLDARLGRINAYYRLGRDARRIGPPRLKFVLPGTFASMLSAGCRPRYRSQAKLPRIVTGAHQRAILEAAVCTLRRQPDSGPGFSARGAA